MPIQSVLAALAWCVLAQEPGIPPLELDCGPLQLEVHVASTASMFHVVDQLAEWSPYCHRQYGRYFRAAGGGLDEADLAQLARHAAVRRERGWGAGLEQTLYSALPLDEALADGVAGGHLTEQQAAIEREVLRHFEERVARLTAEERPRLTAFMQRIEADRERLTELARKLSRFCDGATADVPAFLIPNPDDHDCGGGYNGGRLTVEVARVHDMLPTFQHEVLHAFVNLRREQVAAAAATVAGLDYETLNEGIAHALAPGLFQPEGSTDALAERVAEHIRAGRTLADPYTRFNRYGLALRPLLRDALGDEAQTLTTFLPRAVDAWRVLVELDSAR